MTLIKDDSHVQEALDLLLEQFKDLSNIEGFLTAFINQIQDLEDMYWDVYLDRWATTAVGEQLDVLGRIVGLERNGHTDDAYRLWIRAQILINRSSGTANEILRIVQLVTGNTIQNIRINTILPAVFVVSINEPLGNIDPQIVLDIINTARAAGVRAYLKYTPTGPIFTFDVGPGWDQGHLSGII